MLVLDRSGVRSLGRSGDLLNRQHDLADVLRRFHQRMRLGGFRQWECGVNDGLERAALEQCHTWVRNSRASAALRSKGLARSVDPVMVSRLSMM